MAASVAVATTGILLALVWYGEGQRRGPRAARGGLARRLSGGR